jgi:hypothetical protein
LQLKQAADPVAKHIKGIIDASRTSLLGDANNRSPRVRPAPRPSLQVVVYRFWLRVAVNKLSKSQSAFTRQNVLVHDDVGRFLRLTEIGRAAENVLGLGVRDRLTHGRVADTV